MSDVKTLQKCHCGWSSVTTYHGLRTHQGKKGCTPKKSVTSPGSTKPDAAQIIFNTYMPQFTYTLPPFDQQGLAHLALDETMVIPQYLLDALENNQTQLMFPISKPLEVESPQMFRSQTENKVETRLPAAGMWQTQSMVFGSQQTPAFGDSTVKNVPLFGSAQQPLQSPDHVNKTHSALDSIVGAQQFAKPTSSRQTSTANTNEKENTTSQLLFTGTTPQKTLDFNSKQQPFIKPASFTPQHIASNTGDESMDQNFGTTLPNFNLFGDKQSQSAFGWPTQQFQMTRSEPPNAQTTGANNTSPMEKPGSSLLKGLLVSDGASQQSFGANPVVAQENKPIVGSAQQPLQTSDFTTAQQFPKPTSTSQTSTANTAATNEKENKPLFPSPQQPSQPVQMFGQTSAPQANSNWPNGATETKGETQQYIASPQSQSPSFSAQSTTTGAQQPFYQIPTTQPRPKTSEGALKEHRPVSSSRPPPATKPTGASQTGSVKEEQSGPVTPKTVPQKENEQFFETPKLSHQSAPEGNKTRRALDFSTGAQQAQTSMAIPTTTSQVMLPPVEIEKLRQIQQSQMKAELHQIIRSRVHKLSEIRSRVKACKGSLDEEWLEINNVFSDVIQVVEEARQRALQPLENRKDKLKRESQCLIKTIEEDIERLERAIGEVDTAPDLDAVPLSKLRIKDFSKRTVDTSFSFGTLQQTVSTMMEQVKEELQKLAALELDRAPAFAVDVKLDPTTAHQWLAVSKDGKKVQDEGQIQQQQQLPLAAGRFDTFGSILGANEFRSGRAYWEVQVGGKTGWDLGVASAKANRKGKLTLSPDKGYWAIVHYEGENYAALAAPPVCLKLKEKPQKVGVFLDFEEGLVSFYDVTNQSHIYSFIKCSFSDSIFPYFSPHLKENGKNSEPLVITAVQN